MRHLKAVGSGGDGRAAERQPEGLEVAMRAGAEALRICGGLAALDGHGLAHDEAETAAALLDVAADSLARFTTPTNAVGGAQ